MSEVIECQAAVVWGPNTDYVMETVKVHPPKRGEVRIRILRSALCHTDEYTRSGKDSEGVFPVILGHEGFAQVLDVGAEVTEFQPGDYVIPLYTPECKSCKFCKSNKTNLCQAIRETQGKGLLPDGTSRFECKGKQVFHYMGVSAFSQVSVVSAFSIVKVTADSDPETCALLGCGVTTGFGATQNNVKVEEGDRVAILGLGAVGLAAIQGAAFSKAKQIIAVDINEDKFALARKFGATDCVNPSKLDAASPNALADALIGLSDGGLDYVFECVGSVSLMKLGLLACHKGWGKLVVIGVAAAGTELSFRPFLVVTGRHVLGSAFGGVKGKSQLPQYLELVKLGHIKIADLITGRFGLSQLNEAAHLMHEGKAIRSTFDMSK
eukprot:ANDGO_02699.mRNA.1 putative S-(hydroxymethyl)glutathione dehydrogenase 1